MLANIYRPCSLESNWIRECNRFFPSSELRCKVWTREAWDADTDIRTVWIIRDTKLNDKSGVVRCVRSAQVLSLFADEGHLAFRSMDSARSTVFRIISTFADFVVSISGTPFPLGPKEDGWQTLRSIAGDPRSQLHKWKDPQLTLVTRLFIDPGHWDVLAYRKLVTPFYLCRNVDSTWKRRYIIPQTHKRPTPSILLPNDDAYEAELTKVFDSTKKFRRDGLIDLSDFVTRSDELKLMAWCRLYKKVKGLDQAEQERVLSRELKSTPYTGRMKVLLKELKRCHRTGERFIICADRVFLVTLAVAVSLSLLR